MGLGHGCDGNCIVNSPRGKRSGGHFNPAITFTFNRLGKVEFSDAWLYVIAQFLGAIGGVTLARYVLRGALGNHAVRYAVRVPGGCGLRECRQQEIYILPLNTVQGVAAPKFIDCGTTKSKNNQCHESAA
jgi:hypothetical protein